MIQKSANPSLLVLAGSDEGRVQREAALWAEKMAPPEAGDFGVEVVDGRADNVDHAVSILQGMREALQTLPLFGGEKLVWLKNATFFADNVVGRSKRVLEEVDMLVELIEGGLPHGVRLLMSLLQPDKRRSFFRKAKKWGGLEIYDQVAVSGAGGEEEMMRFLEGEVREFGLQFEPEAMEFLAHSVPPDTTSVRNELEKVDLFCGTERRVDVGIVRRVVTPSRKGVIFELSHFIQKRDLEGALEALQRLLEQGESPIGILLAAVVPTMRQLLLVADILNRPAIRRPRYYRDFMQMLDRLPPEDVAHLPRKKDGGLNAYGLFMASQGAENFSLAELRQGFEGCLEMNYQLVTTGRDPGAILEHWLVQFIAQREKRPASNA